MNSAMRGPVAARPPSAGLDDLIIVPLVLVAVAISKLLKGVFSILIYVLDYAFPILLQLMRIPLLAARLVGDGVEFFLEGALQCLPVSRAKRDALRTRVRQQWIWFRRNISYRAFEQALHHAFEAGMAWVFRKCRRLTPSGALLVIAVALLWLPISFGTATALHATLIARAKSLPAWINCCTPSQPSSLRASCSYCRSTRCLAAGETTSNCAEIFPVLSLFDELRCCPKGAISIPADGTRRRPGGRLRRARGGPHWSCGLVQSDVGSSY
jgi:hypothetical protein